MLVLSLSVVSSQMYIATVLCRFCLVGKVSVVLSLGGSLFVSRLVGYWKGLGGWAFFMASGVLACHRRFCWGLC